MQGQNLVCPNQSQCRPSSGQRLGEDGESYGRKAPFLHVESTGQGQSPAGAAGAGGPSQKPGLRGSAPAASPARKPRPGSSPGTSLLGPWGTWQSPWDMVGLKPPEVPPTTAVKLLGAGTAACFADLLTFPLDTAKVRLQVSAFWPQVTVPRGGGSSPPPGPPGPLPAGPQEGP